MTYKEFYAQIREIMRNSSLCEPDEIVSGNDKICNDIVDLLNKIRSKSQCFVCPYCDGEFFVKEGNRIVECQCGRMVDLRNGIKY